MLFRFMRYDYDKEDKYDSLKMICGYTAKKYDRFLEYLKLMKDYEFIISLGGKWFIIDDIVGSYRGEDGVDMFCTDIYVVEWYQ